jgi:hypothetical protein
MTLNRYVPDAWRLAGYETEMAELAMVAILFQLMQANGYKRPLTDSWGPTWGYR